MEPMLSLDRVSKSYWRGSREIVVLHDVSLSVAAGKLFAVWGQRGAGKSTLAAVAAGIEPPSTGQVLYEGRRHGSQRRGFGPLLHEGVAWVQRRGPHGNEFATMLDYVALPLLRKHSPRTARRHASAMLRRLGLTDAAGATWEALTDGERTLIGLARALVRQPRLLVADDPTANLSLLQRAEVMGLLREVAHEDGAAVLVVVPDMPDAAYADTIASLSEGHIVLAPEPTDTDGEVVQLKSRRGGRSA